MGTLAKKACLGAIEIGAVPDNLVELRSWDYDDQGEEKDFSTMGACDSTIVAGRATRRLEMVLYFASPADAPQDTLQQGVEGLAIIVYPFGKTTGLFQRSGDINILGRRESGDVEGGVELTITATSPAGLVAGTVP